MYPEWVSVDQCFDLSLAVCFYYPQTADSLISWLVSERSANQYVIFVLIQSINVGLKVLLACFMLILMVDKMYGEEHRFSRIQGHVA